MELRQNGPEHEREPVQRARKAGTESEQTGLLGLQRAAGNAAVSRALQRQGDGDPSGGGGGGGAAPLTGGAGGMIPLRVSTTATARVSSDLLRVMADGTHGAAVFDSGAPADVDIENAS
jgi:hypothetical protein